MTKAQKIKALRQAMLDGKEIEFHWLSLNSNAKPLWVKANAGVLAQIRKVPEQFRIKGESK